MGISNEESRVVWLHDCIDKIDELATKNNWSAEQYEDALKDFIKKFVVTEKYNPVEVRMIKDLGVTMISFKTFEDADNFRKDRLQEPFKNAPITESNGYYFLEIEV